MEALRGWGFHASDACRSLGISRSGYYNARRPKRQAKKEVPEKEEEGVLDKIRAICQGHPFWGYRRVWEWLNYREGLSINKKRVYRLMKEQGLSVKQRPLKAKRTPQRSKPRATRPVRLRRMGDRHE